jgi:hypothetical protein
MLAETGVWLLLSYALGTVIGLRMNSARKRQLFEAGATATVDELIELGYLKTRTEPTGETVLIKPTDQTAAK